MNAAGNDSMELFLEEASAHLQFLREYSGLLQEPQSRREDLERLYLAAHTLAGTSATYGFPLFSEVAGKLAHLFQYAMHANIGSEIHGALTEFISDAIAVLEFDLLQISSQGAETTEDIQTFKQRYQFAFSDAAAGPEPEAAAVGAAGVSAPGPEPEVSEGQTDIDPLPPDADIPQEVLEFFLPEAEEHLQVVIDCLLALESKPNPEDVHRLFRAMHTVKGSAAQVGLRRIAAVAHRVEDLIGRLRDGALQPSAEIVDVCLESVDTLKKLLHRRPEQEQLMRGSVEQLLARIRELTPEAETEDAPGTVPDVSVAAGDPSAERPAKSAAVDSSSASRAGQAATAQPRSVRVSLERLNRMMNAVGELVINRTRMVGRLAELEKLVDVLGFSKSRLLDKISNFQEKYEFSRIGASRPAEGQPPLVDAPQVAPSSSLFSARPSLLEFSELEMDRYDDFNILSRSLTEISADVTEVLTQLGAFMGRVETDIDEFTKLAHHLQDEITQARMVAIGNLYTRLSRTARDAAQACGKQVDLVLEGAETELDNNIIQHISDPLIHLVRNAIAHGIEDSDERLRSGKSPRGRVTVRAYHRGNHIYVEVQDDGHGIDYEKIRARAIQVGLVTPAAAADLKETSLQELLFQPGFSTAASKTELAGRGVGLDVVRSNIVALNGEVEIKSEENAGTCFTIKVPLTLIISQALFVRCGSSVFALPLAFVEEIRRVREDEIEEIGGKLLTKVRDVVTEVVRLDNQLGLPPLEATNGYFRMVIVNVANRHAGIVVEEVLGKDEIVIKNLGEYLRRVKLFPGTTIAPDGSLILLIDLNRLVATDTSERRSLIPSATAARVFAPGAAAVAAGSIPVEAIDQVQNDKVAVVADDSISVRKFVGRMLEKAGYRVRLASDGLEAAEIVTQMGCHLVITDLEMPRMNGYELMAHLRQDPVTRRIPVLVVTSRAGAKHRDRAMKEGAAGFLTKPVQEDQLLAAVAQMIGAEAAPLARGPVVSVGQE